MNNHSSLTVSYPSTYINAQFQRFFMKYIPSYDSSSILPLINNEQQFFLLRAKLHTQPSIQQIVVTKSAATVDSITNNNANALRNNQSTTVSTMLPQTTTVKEKDNNKFKNTIFVHCLHEARFEGIKRYIHEVHDSFFKN